MNKEKICCFTGHRPQNLPFGFNEKDERCVLLKEKLRREIIRLYTTCGVLHFISGVALGVDTYCAEIVITLREQCPLITLECAVPCEKQAVKWKEKDRDRYFDIIERCDKETLLQTKYTTNCMQKRNEYMVDKSDYVIAVWHGAPSGTGNTVRYANESGKEVIIINPNEI